MLEIREQPRLPFGRQIGICVDGLHHRLARSLTTLAVVSLAVAFLANILAEGVVVTALRNRTAAIESRDASFRQFADVFAATPDSEALLKKLAMSDSGVSYEIFAKASGLKQSEWSDLRARARREWAILRWLDALSPGYRRSLVGARSGGEAMKTMSDETFRTTFLDKARKMNRSRPTVSLDETLKAHELFRRDLDRASEEIGRWLQEWRSDLAAQEAMAAFLDGRQVDMAALNQSCERHGLSINDDQWRELSGLAIEARDARNLATLVRDPTIAQAWRSSKSVSLDPARAMEELLTRADLAELLANRWPAENGPATLQTVRASAGRLLDVRRAGETYARITERYGDGQENYGSIGWLITLSLLVCVVGVTNAMFVSVLERFREIATMKCLGAMDGFIGSLFVMEAAILGAVGGLIGVTGGLIMGVGRMTWIFGMAALDSLPWTEILICGVLAAFTGVVVTCLAAAYPAFRAAALTPMAAMRVV